MHIFKINYYNIYGGDDINFSYKPCPNCVPVLRKKILYIKDKINFPYKDMMIFIKDNFNEGLYSGLTKFPYNQRNYNIEHIVPFSLFSRIGRDKLNINSILPKNVEPFTDPNIMFTTNIDANIHRNDFILSDDTEINTRFNNRNVNIYLIKDNNNLKTLYDKEYVDYINKLVNKNTYKELFKEKFSENVDFSDNNTIKRIEKISNKETNFVTLDENNIIVNNNDITKINNWFMSPLCTNKCIFSCDKKKCIFNPRFVSKGDISRSLNYFQLVYGYNPHNRNSDQNYFDIEDKEQYKNNNNWLGNFDKNNNFLHFDDDIWNDYYYNQLNMLYRWTNEDVLNDKEHDRNIKIAKKTGFANIFVGAWDKNGEYIKAEYSKDGRNWFKDLFLGNDHDCEFYQSLEVSPPLNFNKLFDSEKKIDNKNLKEFDVQYQPLELNKSFDEINLKEVKSQKYIPPHRRKIFT